MRKIIAILSVLSFIGCQSEPEKKAEPIPQPEGIPEGNIYEDQLEEIKEVHEDTWMGQKVLAREFLNDEAIERLSRYKEKAEDIGTEDEMEEHYSQAILMPDHVAAGLIEPSDSMLKAVGGIENYAHHLQDTLSWFSDVFPGLVFSCIAECSEPRVVFNFKWFRKRSRQTAGKADDQFFQIMIDAYGEVGGRDVSFGSWFQQTWDYGGASRLGDGVHTSLLARIDAYTHDGAFKQRLLILRERILDDALAASAYKNEVDSIVGELEQLLVEVKLSKAEIDAIKNRIEEVKNHDENNIQVNCSEGDCSFG